MKRDVEGGSRAGSDRKRAVIGSDSTGGFIDVYGNDEKIDASMSVGLTGGTVGVSNDGMLRALLAVRPEGGFIEMIGSDGQARARMP